MNSEWDHNATGILPNTLTSEPDPPQAGAYIVDNYVHDNNDTRRPGTGITAIAPVGFGIGSPAAQDNVVRGNLIRNQKHDGVAIFWLFTPPINNQVALQHVQARGLRRLPRGRRHRVRRPTACRTASSHNVDVTGGHTQAGIGRPAQPARAWTSCGDANPTRASRSRRLRAGRPAVQPHDWPSTRPASPSRRTTRDRVRDRTAMQTMANPCAGVPANPWCSHGKPRFAVPKH